MLHLNSSYLSFPVMKLQFQPNPLLDIIYTILLKEFIFWNLSLNHAIYSLSSFNLIYLLLLMIDLTFPNLRISSFTLGFEASLLRVRLNQFFTHFFFLSIQCCISRLFLYVHSLSTSKINLILLWPSQLLQASVVWTFMSIYLQCYKI